MQKATSALCALMVLSGPAMANDTPMGANLSIPGLALTGEIASTNVDAPTYTEWRNLTIPDGHTLSTGQFVSGAIDRARSALFGNGDIRELHTAGLSLALTSEDLTVHIEADRLAMSWPEGHARRETFELTRMVAGEMPPWRSIVTIDAAGLTLTLGQTSINFDTLRIAANIDAQTGVVAIDLFDAGDVHVSAGGIEAESQTLRAGGLRLGMPMFHLDGPIAIVAAAMETMANGHADADSSALASGIDGEMNDEMAELMSELEGMVAASPANQKPARSMLALSPDALPIGFTHNAMLYAEASRLSGSGFDISAPEIRMIRSPEAPDDTLVFLEDLDAVIDIAVPGFDAVVTDWGATLNGSGFTMPGDIHGSLDLRLSDVAGEAAVSHFRLALDDLLTTQLILAANNTLGEGFSSVLHIDDTGVIDHFLPSDNARQAVADTLRGYTLQTLSGILNAEEDDFLHDLLDRLASLSGNWIGEGGRLSLEVQAPAETPALGGGLFTLDGLLSVLESSHIHGIVTMAAVSRDNLLESTE